MGVTGGSGAHRMATRQFRTPSLPRVIVCTDTLKEGVDLHLFCDRVLHYGVAWTSGDLEQRVGRVDRFFSRIERRLHTEDPPPAVTLQIGYPHVVASLERFQIERVIRRQKRAEALMNSPLAGVRHEDKNMVIGASAPRSEDRELDPYRPYDFPDTGRSLVMVSRSVAKKSADHYARWYEQLVEALRERGHRISPDGPTPVREATLHGDHHHELSWSFDPALGWYFLSISNPPWPDGAHGGRRRVLVGRRRQVESFVRLRVPTPEEGLDPTLIDSLLAVLGGQVPRMSTESAIGWMDAFTSLVSGEAPRLAGHQLSMVVSRGERAHSVTVSAYQGYVRIVGIIAPLSELKLRGEWGGRPTVKSVRDWALDTTNNLALGYLAVNHRDELLFGVNILHGVLSPTAQIRLVEEVAWRADVWEAALTGTDRR